MIRTVALLLWLRYRTMFRGGSGGRQAFAVVIGLLVLVPLSVGLGAFSLATTRYIAGSMAPEALLLFVQLAFLLVFAMLLAMPIISFAATDFYDITKLFHLPVSHRPVFVAQIIGMVCGGTPLFFLPAMLGVVVGASGGAARAFFSIPVLLLFLFQTVALARLLQLLLLNTLRSRRFRDLAAIGAACLSAGLFVLFRLTFDADSPTRNVAAFLEDLLASGAANWVSAFPSSWIAALMVPGAGLGPILLVVLVALPLTALTVWVAAILQERAFHGEVPVAQPRARTAGVAPAGRGPGLLRFLPEPVRAVARREILLIRREPIVKTTLIQQAVFFLIPVAIAVFGQGGGAHPGVGALLRFGVFVLLFVESILAMNFFGLEGSGIVVTLSSPTPRHQVLLGKCLAYFLLFAPVNVLFVLATAILVRILHGEVEAATVAVALIGAVSATLVLLGTGSIVSVLVPLRMTGRSRGALRQSGTGEGCLMALLRMVAILVLAVLVAPIVLLGLVPALSVLSLVYGALALLAGAMIGAHLCSGREERLMLTLARSTD
jgi:ABC-2 type transport system permease protein